MDWSQKTYSSAVYIGNTEWKVFWLVINPQTKTVTSCVPQPMKAVKGYVCCMRHALALNDDIFGRLNGSYRGNILKLHEKESENWRKGKVGLGSFYFLVSLDISTKLNRTFGAIFIFVLPKKRWQPELKLHLRHWMHCDLNFIPSWITK